jgi:hypothetical protein
MAFAKGCEVSTYVSSDVPPSTLVIMLTRTQGPTIIVRHIGVHGPWIDSRDRPGK